MSIERPFDPSYKTSGQPFDATPEEKPKTSSIDVPPELQEYVPEAERFVDQYKEIFHAISGDRSIDYKIGTNFVIDLKKGEIHLNVNDWKWAAEKGLSEWQQLWSTCHEISHYKDLREGPQEMLGNFEYLEHRAAEMAPRIVDIWQKKSGGTLPDYLTTPVPIDREGKRTKSFAEVFVYKRLHMLYNSLDDIYVNKTLALRSGIFAPGGSQAPEVERLYRDYLFATQPQEIGKPPQELEATDYEKLPRCYQLAYALLRRHMVPNQPILLSPEVQNKLEGFSDATAQKMGITLEAEVASITNPATTKAKNPGWRYRRIKQAVEPAFLELLLKDAEEMPLPQPPQHQPGGQQQTKPQPGQGEAQPSDPWQPLDDKPEPIDLDTIKDFIKQQDEKKKEDAAKKKADKAVTQLTPQEKIHQAIAQADQKICEQYAVDPHLANEYRQLEQSIEPYKRDLAAVFEEVMNTISQRVSTFWAEGFRSGTFNIDSFIRKYSPEIAAERPDLIPWDKLDVYDQREIISRLVLFPDRLRVRLVLDGSGSMNEERIRALKQLSVLFLESLSTFEETVNLRFRLKEPLRVDTEIRMFGSTGKSETIKTFAQGKTADEAERVDRFKAFGNINNSYGGTCDAEPLWGVAQSLDSSLVADLKAQQAKEFVFEITDGGSNETSSQARSGTSPEQDTRNAVEALEASSVVIRGFQVGDPSDEEKRIFDRIWGNRGAHIPHPKDLAASVAALLAEELKKTQFQVQYYEEDEEKA